jgi:hypothetical protein
MNQLQLSEINKKMAIPAKTRTTKKKSLLLSRMERLGIGHSFTVQGADIKAVAPTIYATAKRAGIKVALRVTDEGVGVWRVKDSETSRTRQTKAA